jgi:hypothetical protein
MPKILRESEKKIKVQVFIDRAAYGKACKIALKNGLTLDDGRPQASAVLVRAIHKALGLKEMDNTTLEHYRTFGITHEQPEHKNSRRRKKR